MTPKMPISRLAGPKMAKNWTISQKKRFMLKQQKFKKSKITNWRYKTMKNYQKALSWRRSQTNKGKIVKFKILNKFGNQIRNNNRLIKTQKGFPIILMIMIKRKMNRHQPLRTKAMTTLSVRRRRPHAKSSGTQSRMSIWRSQKWSKRRDRRPPATFWRLSRKTKCITRSPERSWR